MTNPWQAGDVDPARVRKAAAILKEGRRRVAVQAPPAKVPVPRTVKAMKELEESVQRRCREAGITDKYSYVAVYPFLKATGDVTGDPAVAIPLLEEIGLLAEEIADATGRYANQPGGPSKDTRELLKFLRTYEGSYEEWKKWAHRYVFKA